MKKQQLFTLAAATISAATLSSCGFAEQKDIRLSEEQSVSFMGEEMSFERIPVDCDAKGIYIPQVEDDPYVDASPNERMLKTAQEYDLPVEAGSALTYETYQENRERFQTLFMKKYMEQEDVSSNPIAQGMARSLLPGIFDSAAAQMNEVVIETCNNPKQD